MSVRDTVIRAALAKWLADRIGVIRSDLAMDAKDGMDKGDRKKAVLEDGTVIGSVTITDPKWKPKVVDGGALFAWVQEHAPSEIETPPPPHRQIRPAFVEKLLNSASNVAGNAVDAETGEVIPGIAFEQGKSNATVTVTPEQAEAIQAALDDGRLLKILQSLTTTIEPKELNP